MNGRDEHHNGPQSEINLLCTAHMPHNFLGVSCRLCHVRVCPYSEMRLPHLHPSARALSRVPKAPVMLHTRRMNMRSLAIACGKCRLPNESASIPSLYGTRVVRHVASHLHPEWTSATALEPTTNATSVGGEQTTPRHFVCARETDHGQIVRVTAHVQISHTSHKRRTRDARPTRNTSEAVAGIVNYIALAEWIYIRMQPTRTDDDDRRTALVRCSARCMQYATFLYVAFAG